MRNKEDVVGNLPARPRPPRWQTSLLLSRLLTLSSLASPRYGGQRPEEAACSFPAIYAMAPGINFSRINSPQEARKEGRKS